MQSSSNFQPAEQDVSESSSSDDPDFIVDATPKRKTKPDTIAITLPRKDLLKETTDLSIRLGLSASKQVAVTGKMIKLGKGDLNDVTISKSSAKRHRRSTTITRQSEINSDLPDHLILHWDGKDIVFKSGPNEDRLCIKVSFPGTDKPDQFLSAPIIQPPDGNTM